MYLGSTVGIGVVMLFGWMTAFVSLGLTAFGITLIVDPKYLEKASKREEEKIKLESEFEKEKEPFWWVNFRDSESVTKEYEKLDQRARVLNK